MFCIFIVVLWDIDDMWDIDIGDLFSIKIQKLQQHFHMWVCTSEASHACFKHGLETQFIQIATAPLKSAELYEFIPP